MRYLLSLYYGVGPREMKIKTDLAHRVRRIGNGKAIFPERVDIVDLKNVEIRANRFWYLSYCIEKELYHIHATFKYCK